MKTNLAARRRSLMTAWMVSATLCLGRGAADEVPLPSAQGKPAAFAATVRPFLLDYCAECHGAKQQKGERRFDQLAGEINNDDQLVDFQDILDQLNLGEMPPPEVRQPQSQQRRQVIAWLTDRIERFHRSRQTTGANTVLRRLNSREYRNTVRDLLHLNVTMFDPTSGFPRDQTREHLDNVGSSLVTSGHLLAAYLDAANQVIEKAVGPRRRPSVQNWTFRDGFRQQPEIDQVHGKVNGFKYLTLYDVVGADKHEGAYGPIHALATGVPHDGVYEMQIKAEAVNRRHPYDPALLGTDPDEPLRLGIVAGNHLAGPLHKPQPIEPLLAELDLADEPRWYTVRVWLDAGFTPRFTFRNGLMDVRELWGRLLSKYEDQFPPRTNRGIVEARFNAIKFGKLPQIRIHEVEIEGPFYDQWPTPSQRALLGDDWERVEQSGRLSPEQARRQLADFASRAYRRPAQAAEIDRAMQVVEARRAAGSDPLEAFADGLKMVLCSPSFLYLDQSPPAVGSAVEGEGAVADAGKNAADGRLLPPLALASRLSYFLWSSMPDQPLIELAAAGRLSRPQVLDSQVDRMLNDPRSNGFVEGFSSSWLTLRDLGSSPPDRKAFRDYYHYDLGTAMRRETQRFTRHLIDENLSIANFLDSDFTYVNKPLARHYGIPAPEGDGFQLVSLNDRRRGGLLTQASVLTVTANGIDTSPVVRGVWLLENILGTPPSPPPPDVEPLDPDIRGATTIRDQLKKHRNVASCNDCHRKIDPLGFALENFDPIGRWRSSYGNRAKIDASGTLPNGRKFQDIDGLKAILTDQQGQFATALTSKLLAYGTGRLIEASDRPHIDGITAELAKRGSGMRDLLKLVVQSSPFLSR